MTDLAKIKTVARVPIAAKSSFDFMQDIGDNEILIRYRDGSGFALIVCKKYNHPELLEMPSLEQAKVLDPLGQTGFLVASSKTVAALMPPAQDFRVLETSDLSHPKIVATISDVKQQLNQENTGTIFLLNRDGVTIIRQPQVEQEEYAEQYYTN